MEREELYSKTSSTRQSTEERFKKVFDTLNKLIAEENDISLGNFELRGKIEGLSRELSKYEKALDKWLAVNEEYSRYEKVVTKEYLPEFEKNVSEKWSLFEEKWWEWEREDVVYWFMFKFDWFTRIYGEKNKECNFKTIVKAMMEQGIAGDNLETLNILGIMGIG